MGNIIHEKFVFQDEVERVLDEELRRAIRTIMFIVESQVDDQEKTQIISKAVKRYINDYHRKTLALIEKIK